MESPTRILEAKDLTKYFGSLAANRSITLGLERGLVHAILGENGAGKSTFAKILAGALRPTSGEVLVGGTPVELRSPRDGIRHGVGMVQQHPSLIPELSLAENCIYGFGDNARGRLDPEPVFDELEQIGAELGFERLPRSPIGTFSIGQRQRGEILRILRRNAEVLIFDEPTDVLTPQEGTQLFETLAGIAKRGKAVVFITHRLSEVFDAADLVTVFRDGEHVGTTLVSETNKAELIRWMLGRSYSPPVRPPGRAHDALLLRAHGAVTAEAGSLEPVSLTLAPGEILGVAGVEGNGQEALAGLIAGTMEMRSGTLLLEGADVGRCNAAERRERGVAYIPSDRQKEGLVLDLTVAENIHLRSFAHRRLTHRDAWRVDRDKMRRRADQLVEQFDIRCRSVSQVLRQLSGGNQQKVILARELSGSPRLIIASQPTRGLDVAARAFVHSKLIEQTAQGAGVLLISSDLEELMILADRVVVIARGRLVEEFHGPNFDPMEIGHSMTTGENTRA